MKRTVLYFFAGMGVLFSVLLLGILWFYVTDPYNLKPLLFGTMNSSLLFEEALEDATIPDTTQATDTASQETSLSETSPSPSAGFVLLPAQRQALIQFGVDPAAIPAEITGTQMTCFVEALGAPRVAEIQSGAVPTPIEFLRANVCI
jgi:hypothetical protein